MAVPSRPQPEATAPGLPDHVRGQLEEISRRTPRYLFRFHHSRSGGDAKLNTREAIITHADLHGNFPDSVYDLPLERLRELVTAHLSNQDCDSPFSSWSHSLNFVLARCAANVPGGSMSILDTKKLPARNTVLYTAAMKPVIGAKVNFWEYLCFGTVVSGEAHRIVSYERLLRRGSEFFPARELPVGHPHPGFYQILSEKDVLEQAKHVVELFDDHFRLPVTIFLLAHHYADIPEGLTRTLRPADVPVEWCDDPAIIKKGYALAYPYLDATIAIDCFRNLVSKFRPEMKMSGAARMAHVKQLKWRANMDILIDELRSETEEEEEEEEEEILDASSDGDDRGEKILTITDDSGRSVPATPRQKKELKRLRIDMIWWPEKQEQHSNEVREDEDTNAEMTDVADDEFCTS
ncbi:uncharacterized protein LTR77_001627 [Saxophila tyrrhenica]|uniref:DUF7587 domain-containing protein n=1 Tax=Saxophila tyrrhenica TaxID=1690608 RepID=A0AAV9PNQ6_9PEZI|nr:hypothetical protein LTR77_001627 [Saxophila tyrrhenica]